MPDIQHCLQGRDLGFLRIVALFWGLELDAPDARVGLQRLAPMLLDQDQLMETLAALPGGAGQALDDLLRSDGRLPWALFTRRYGQVREMGAARRDRERPYENTHANAAEALWYRALIGRAFFETPDGAEELAYIPDDLLELMPAAGPEDDRPLGRLATPAEREYILPASDWILDDAATLLAALRLGGLPGGEAADIRALLPGPQAAALTPLSPSLPVLQGLLAAAGLLDAQGMPLPDPARRFLEASRGEALSLLLRGWLHAADYNELLLLPGLAAEGEWRNDPLRARQAVLDFLSGVPGGLPAPGRPAERPWCSLNAFIQAVKQLAPDFQRPAGDYDSWFLRDLVSGAYLRGFEHWERVEGDLLRYLVAGVLHWLGVTEIALPEAPRPGQRLPVTAFRFSDWAADLLALNPPAGLAEESETLQVTSDGRVLAPRLAPRSVRYQIARFCAWEGFAQDSYRYRLTPESLEKARSQGLQVRHLLVLLRRGARAVPPGLVQALERWEAQGSQARLERISVLRVKDPAILQALKSSKAGRFLGEPLGTAAVIVRAGAWDKVAAALAELGYLAEVEIEK